MTSPKEKFFDPITRQILLAAINEDKTAKLVLLDRLEEIIEPEAVEAWNWALVNKRHPLKVKNIWKWFLPSNKYYKSRFPYDIDHDDLDILRDTPYGHWKPFDTKLEAWEWLLLSWKEWKLQGRLRTILMLAPPGSMPSP